MLLNINIVTVEPMLDERGFPGINVTFSKYKGSEVHSNF